MKKIMIKPICIALLTSIILMGCTQRYNNKLKVQVSLDPRIELVSILCYLSGYEEYNKSQIESYKSEVDTYFEPFRNHEAVAFMKEIREKYQTGYEIPMNFAVYLTDSLMPSVPFDQLPSDFNPRWNKEMYDHLSILVKKFALDTRFSNFFQSLNERYTQDIRDIEKEINSSINFDWFASFFGNLPQHTNIQIIICLNNGTCSYGSHTKIGDTQTLYPIIGAQLNSQKISVDYSNIIHELCHPLCNPIIDEFHSKLEHTGKLVREDYIKRTHQKAYGSWESIIYETMVRASVSCYIKKHGGAIPAWMNNRGDKGKGFMWILPIRDSFLKLNTTTNLYESKELYMNAFVKDLDAYFNFH